MGAKGTSPKKAVASHVRKPLVVTMDVKDFFPSVKPHMIREMLRVRGWEEAAVEVTTRLVTRKNHLPQGAPTSPCIGRLILDPVARELEKLLTQTHTSCAASIWVDDLTVSGPEGISRLKKTITRIFERYGFEIHPQKINVMFRSDDQVSLGIKLNDGTAPTKQYLAKIEELAKQVPAIDAKLKAKRVYAEGLRN
jgi:RNA-directed DNA polymerase